MVVNTLGESIDPKYVLIIDKEGDFDEWKDKKTGYKCRIHRVGDYGHWCGYVRLPDNSIIGSNCHYDNIPVDVHGGITWFDKFPIPNLDDNGIWVGFDCAHSCDYVPNMGKMFGEHAVYRTKTFVKKEVRKLAKQLKELEVRKLVKQLKELEGC